MSTSLDIIYPDPIIHSIEFFTGPQGPAGPPGAGGDLSDVTPLPTGTAGTATPGVSAEGSRDDHVHALGPVIIPVQASLAVPSATSGAVQVYTNRPSAGFPAELRYRSDLSEVPFTPIPYNLGRHTFRMSPGGGTTPTVDGGALNSAGNGTISHGTLFDTNTNTRRVKMTLVSGATTNARGILGLASRIISRRAGFDVTFSDWDIAIIQPNMRMIVGFTATMPGTTQNPVSMVNGIAVGCDSGSANLQRYHNDGTGAATATAYSSSFPLLANERYTVRFFCEPSGNPYIELVNLTTPASSIVQITTDLPDVGAFMNPYLALWIGSAGASAQANLCALYGTRGNPI